MAKREPVTELNRVDWIVETALKRLAEGRGSSMIGLIPGALRVRGGKLNAAWEFKRVGELGAKIESLATGDFYRDTWRPIDAPETGGYFVNFLGHGCNVILYYGEDDDSWTATYWDAADDRLDTQEFGSCSEMLRWLEAEVVEA